MDPSNLKTASTYVNNLLLARGLLRNGKPVDLAALLAPASARCNQVKEPRTDFKHKRDDTNGPQVVVQVINLVHDLILRRDRDQDQLSSLTSTLTTLRSTQSHQSTTIARLETSNRDLRRQIDTSTASVRSANSAVHSAESAAKALREELSRAKTTLAQVRQQCANDVRKRDVQLQRLKGHLTGTQRGSNARVIGPSCTITTASKSGNAHPLRGSIPNGTNVSSTRDHKEAQPSLEDAEYSLKQETTEFLTQLSQSMSDENDALISLVKDTLSTLRQLMDMPAGPTARPEEPAGDDMVSVVPTSFDTLSTDLEFVLAKLQVLLTRDDFVPINEVYAREEEILRLREGWEKMGGRWQEAVEMMQSWQAKLNGGGTVMPEDLTRGLNLGEGLQLLDSPLVTRSANADEKEHEAQNSESSLVKSGDDQIFEAPDLENESSPLASPPISRALQEASANVASPSAGPSRARKLRLQREQDQQENKTRASVHSGSSAGNSVHSNRTLDLDLKDLNLSRDEPRARAAHKPTIPSSNASSRHSDLPPTRQKPVPHSPLHKHISTLMSSSSSPEAPPSNRRLAFKCSRTTQLSTSSPSKTKGLSRPMTARSATASEPAPPIFADDAEALFADETQHDAAADSAVPTLSVKQKLRLAEVEARRLSVNSLPSSEPAFEESDGASNGLDIVPSPSPKRDGLSQREEPREGATKRRDSRVVIVRSPARPERSTRVRGTMAQGRARKRKSTLSPEELEELMGLRSATIEV